MGTTKPQGFTIKTMRIPVDLDERFRQLANRQGRSQNDMFIKAIEQLVEAEGTTDGGRREGGVDAPPS